MNVINNLGRFAALLYCRVNSRFLPQIGPNRYTTIKLSHCRKVIKVDSAELPSVNSLLLSPSLFSRPCAGGGDDRFANPKPCF